METKTRTQFICPACGGHYFGSGDNGDGTRTYNCQDSPRRGGNCTFTVHEMDFWKHNFTVTTTVVPFASREDYIKNLNNSR